jgi:cytochrome c
MPWRKQARCLRNEDTLKMPCESGPRGTRPRRDHRARAAAGAAGPLLIALLLAACDAGGITEPLSGGSARAGRELLAQYQCGSCHLIPGVRAARGSYGPTLERFGLRGYIAGEIPNTPALLEAWIRDPAALVPGTLMPSMGASPSDAQAMASYLLSLR